MTGKAEIALEQRTQSQNRLSSPSAGRNRQVIAETLAEIMPHGARVIEIASGTGEHALSAVTVRPDLIWQPSELDPQSRQSVDAWALDASGRIAPCLEIDVTDPEWTNPLPDFDALFCANMIHIAPWQACLGLFEGGADLLVDGGLVCLYGPFLEGNATAPSNLEFDKSLKSRNAEWGVRALDDVVEQAHRSHFQMTQRLKMPANNLMLVFTKGAAP